MVVFLAQHPMEFMFLDIPLAKELFKHIAFLNTRNKLLTKKLFKQGYQFRITFYKFYPQYYDLISKFHSRNKFRLRQEISEKIAFGYDINVLRHTACLVG